MHRGIDDQVEVDARGKREALGDRLRRIGGILNPADDLKRRAIFLPGECGQIVGQTGLGPVERFQDGHRNRLDRHGR